MFLRPGRARDLHEDGYPENDCRSNASNDQDTDPLTTTLISCAHQ